MPTVIDKFASCQHIAVYARGLCIDREIWMPERPTCYRAASPIVQCPGSHAARLAICLGRARSDTQSRRDPRERAIFAALRKPESGRERAGAKLDRHPIQGQLDLENAAAFWICARPRDVRLSMIHEAAATAVGAVSKYVSAIAAVSALWGCHPNPPKLQGPLFSPRPSIFWGRCRKRNLKYVKPQEAAAAA